MRAASRLNLKVLRFDSNLFELNRLSNEAWIEANFWMLCIRLVLLQTLMSSYEWDTERPCKSDIADRIGSWFLSKARSIRRTSSCSLLSSTSGTECHIEISRK